MTRENLDWNDLRFVAQMTFKDEDAAWEDLSGVPEPRDAVKIEEGWLNGFVEGAVEILEAVDDRRA